jgi:cyclopropane fatty-acyl-phospholipid synthase-like methyltransferase
MSSGKSYLDPYFAAVDAFGDDFATTLWKSRAGQAKRFDVLCAMLGPDLVTGSRLVDVGCGRGDFALWLRKAGVRPLHYEGVDAVEAMVDMAKPVLEDVGFPTGLSVFDPLERPDRLRELKPDVIVASGTLNAMSEEVAQRFIEVLMEHATTAIAFNFLSLRHRKTKSKPLGPSHRFDPLAMLDLVLKVTPNVQFRQDYLDGHDASIVAFLEPNA